MYFLNMPGMARNSEGLGDNTREDSDSQQNNTAPNNHPASDQSTSPFPNHSARDEDSKNNGSETPINLVMYGHALLREAILNGSANNLCHNLHLWIEKARLFLNYADAGVETLNNIVNVTRDNLARATGAAAPGEFGAESLAMPASSFKLFWDLIRTPEFQQFFGRMLAQMLQPKFQGSG